MGRMPAWFFRCDECWRKTYRLTPELPRGWVLRPIGLFCAECVALKQRGGTF